MRARARLYLFYMAENNGKRGSILVDGSIFGTQHTTQSNLIQFA